MEELKELLDNILHEIRSRNSFIDKSSIPLSNEFFEKIATTYDVIRFNIPTLIDILVKSRKIFSFPVVDDDRKNKILKVDGLVVTEGNIIKEIKKYFEDKLINLYTREFNEKLMIEKLADAFFPKLKEYNNTEIGRTGKIVFMLSHYEALLEKDILNYSKKIQEKLLLELLEQYNIADFVNMRGDVVDVPMRNVATNRQSIDKSANNNKESLQRRAMDQNKYADFKSYSSKNSMEKTLSLYGIEFYTRVCFRDYRFDLIQKLVESDIVKRKSDLIKVKKMLQTQRMNSDQDLNLQNYALQINQLEKSLNQKIKKME